MRVSKHRESITTGSRSMESMESQMVQNSPGFHRRMIIKTPFS